MCEKLRLKLDLMDEIIEALSTLCNSLFVFLQVRSTQRTDLDLNIAIKILKEILIINQEPKKSKRVLKILIRFGQTSSVDLTREGTDSSKRYPKTA